VVNVQHQERKWTVVAVVAAYLFVELQLELSMVVKPRESVVCGELLKLLFIAFDAFADSANEPVKECE
jgi:hypothetical protein